MVVLDANIIIDHLRTKGKESRFRQIKRSHNKELFAISMISVQELYVGKSTRDKNEILVLTTLLSQLKILPYAYETARKAGEIARDLVQDIELADAAIAATSILHEAKLATLNTKDFRGIKELQLLEM